MKSDVYTWLFNIIHKNGLNKKRALAFARNYTEDKTALKDITRRFKNHVLKKQFEKIIYDSLQLQSSLEYTLDLSLIHISEPTRPY